MIDVLVLSVAFVSFCIRTERAFTCALPTCLQTFIKGKQQNGKKLKERETID